jgi:hypothetical protein
VYDAPEVGVFLVEARDSAMAEMAMLDWLECHEEIQVSRGDRFRCVAVSRTVHAGSAALRSDAFGPGRDVASYLIDGRLFSEFVFSEIACNCGVRLRIQQESVRRPDAPEHRFRCPDCGAGRSVRGSIIEIAAFREGDWRTLLGGDWIDLDW